MASENQLCDQAAQSQPDSWLEINNECHKRYDSSFNKAESILRNLPSIQDDSAADQSSAFEIDSVMVELERQKIAIVRQVVRV